MPTDKWDYARKPLIPGTRLYAEWITYPPNAETTKNNLLQITEVAGDDTGHEWPPITRHDVERLHAWLDGELGGSE